MTVNLSLIRLGALKINYDNLELVSEIVSEVSFLCLESLLCLCLLSQRIQRTRKRTKEP